MPIKLARNSYGKTDVKCAKVIREGKLHHLLQFDGAVQLIGDFGKAFTDGDNGTIIATDSMKTLDLNTTGAAPSTGPVPSANPYP